MRKLSRYFSLILIILFIFFSGDIRGQFFIDRKLYIKSGLCIGNFLGGRVSVEYINKKNISFSTTINVLGRKSKNLPNDYVPSSGLFSAMSFGLDYPSEEFNSYHLLAGRIIYLKQNKIRLNLSSGLGYSNYSCPENFVKLDYLGSTGNYSYKNKKYDLFAFIINPSIDFAFFRCFGLSAGFKAIITQKTYFFGIDISYLLGIVRNKI